MRKMVPVLVCAALLGGCAHAPPATIGYRLARTEVRFRVVRTVSCDKENRPIIATAVTPSTRHVADDQAHYSFALASVQGWFADTDTTFTFYDDRRLSNINATSAGNGAQVLKTAVSIAGGVAAFDGRGEAAACASVAAAGNQKPLNLVYEGALQTDPGAVQIIAPDQASAVYANDANIHSLVHAICAVVEKTEAGFVPVNLAPGGGASITAREPGMATIRIAVSPDGVQCGALALWHDRLPVAQLGRLYQLPVPRAALFGKQTFAASFAESGALTMVQYGASGAAANGVNALDALVALNKGDSAAQQAAELKAQADLLYQQQRLVDCLADQASCK